MYRHSLPFVNMISSNLNEISNDCIFRTASIWKLHLMDFDAFPLEISSIVKLIIEPNNPFNFTILELAHQITWTNVL